MLSSILIGIATFVVLIVAAYVVYLDSRKGGMCNDCKGCSRCCCKRGDDRKN